MTERISTLAEDVVTVGRGAAAPEIARRMQREAVGSVVVLADDGAPVGIVTDRDLLLRVIAPGRDASTTTAENIMSQPLVTIDANEPLERAIGAMAGHGIRRVPVVHEGRLVGILALDDLLARLGRELDDAGRGVSGAANAARAEARRVAALEQLRGEVEQRIHGLREQIDHVGQQVREAVGREIDAIRDRVRRVLQ
jgi:CBS domain-containing protein